MYLKQIARLKNNLNPRGEQPQSNLQDTTISSFEGGLNVADTDLNMAPKYAKVLDNIERAPDGSLSLRPGTKLFAYSAASQLQTSSTTPTSRTKSSLCSRMAGSRSSTALAQSRTGISRGLDRL
jgi:hypothetical protein